MSAYDVAVIGSGAGGSVMAYRLARAGLKVIVLERGGREDTSTFSHNEYDMIPRLYKMAGTQTSDDHAISFLQGQTVGGSTVINNAIWLRADLERVLPVWQSLGAHVDPARLEHAYGVLESALQVSPIPPELMNGGTGVFLRGCQRLGINAVPLSHNRANCLGCGFCNYGCRYDRKNSMLVTFIPWAERRGARIIDQARHVALVPQGDRVTRVDYVRFGKSYSVEADAVVVACGAIGSSELLLRSRVKSEAKIGSSLHFLGGVLVVAEVAEQVDAFDKIGLTYMAKASPDYVLETFFAPPAAFAASLGGLPEGHAALMRRYAYLAQAGAMVGTEPVGNVAVKDDRVHIDYRLTSGDLEKLRRGIKELARIYLAGGAKAVSPATCEDVRITEPQQLDQIDKVARRAADLVIGSAHPQGGNVMSADPKRGVVDCNFRVHGYKNLYVADSSVFPSNLWANCQATVMAMSYLAADSLLGRREASSLAPGAEALL